MLSLSSARELAGTEAQKYNKEYDKKALNHRVGDWVFAHFPEEESEEVVPTVVRPV